MTSLLADLTPAVPLAVTGSWIIGLLGAAGLVAIALQIAVNAKKLFGRVPPLENSLRDEIRDGDSALATRIEMLRSDVDQRFADLHVERERNLKELHEKMNGIAADVHFIRGKISH